MSARRVSLKTMAMLADAARMYKITNENLLQRMLGGQPLDENSVYAAKLTTQRLDALLQLAPTLQDRVFLPIAAPRVTQTIDA